MNLPWKSLLFLQPYDILAFNSLNRTIRSRVGLYPGIDIRGEGGYVLGVGSKINGKFYQDVNKNVDIVFASISDIRFYPDRGIDKVLTLKLVESDYIDEHLNVIVVSATGTGKTFYISALEIEACKKAKNVKYV